LINSKGGTSSGELANLYAGISHLQLGQFEAAIDYLKDYSPSGSMMPIVKNGVMGDAYSELSQFDNALSYYQKAVSAGDNEMLTPYYLLKLGMLNLKQNNMEASKDAFQKIKEKYPLSQINRDAEKYLSRVEAKLYEKDLPEADHLQVGIVVSDWNSEITHALYEGCFDTLIKHGVKEDRIKTIQVPGAFELPVGAKMLVGQHKLDAVICLGCVIKGETSHNEYINNAVAMGLVTMGLARALRMSGLKETIKGGISKIGF